MTVVERIYSELGMTLAREVRVKMETYIHDNAQYKRHGKHFYSLEEIGLSESQVSEAFDFYKH